MKKPLKRPLCGKAHSLLPLCLGAALLAAGPAAAESVKLKVLVVAAGEEAGDLGLAYIKPVLEEMGVPYDVLNTVSDELTAAKLSPNGCSAEQVGCVGNYNGIILTDSQAGGNLSVPEWGRLHAYEANFRVREAVLSGAPVAIPWPWPPADVHPYLDYGLGDTKNYCVSTDPSLCQAPIPFAAQWQQANIPAKEVFEYLKLETPLAITDFAFAATPRPNLSEITLADGTRPSVVPLLTTPNNEALVSIIKYTIPTETTPKREVLYSSITNNKDLTHSQVLAYEFVNWATKGVFVGQRRVYFNAHLDDLFIPDELWNIPSDTTTGAPYKLSGLDISQAVSQQTAFRTAYPTAGSAFKLDFAFNGGGAVVDPAAAVNSLVLKADDDLVAAIQNPAYKNEFRYINHTLTHADMDNPPVPPNPDCDYDTFANTSAGRTLIQAEITKNRKVWQLLALPEQSANNRVLVSGNHSGLKDRKCTDTPELHPEMVNVQSDDIPFPTGANANFFKAAAAAGVDYLASDSSQLNQNVEKYVTEVNDGSSQNRILLPRYPTNLYYNTINPQALVDEFCYIQCQPDSNKQCQYTGLGYGNVSFLKPLCQAYDNSQSPANVAAAYQGLLTYEAETALKHMISYKKWPHFFHQSNLAAYNPTTGDSLMFDWLKAVFGTYQQFFKLPVKNHPYYLIGDKAKEKLTAQSAAIQATWDRVTNKVTLSANKSVPSLPVTGVSGGEVYGGQLIREISVTTTPKTFTVNQALNQ